MQSTCQPLKISEAAVSWNEKRYTSNESSSYCLTPLQNILIHENYRHHYEHVLGPKTIEDEEVIACLYLEIDWKPLLNNNIVPSFNMVNLFKKKYLDKQ